MEQPIRSKITTPIRQLGVLVLTAMIALPAFAQDPKAFDSLQMKGIALVDVSVDADYYRCVVVPASYVIVIIAAFWVFQRTDLINIATS